MDRMERVLRTAQGCTAGVWAGMSLYRVWDYKARPGWYAMAPDPWHRQYSDHRSGGRGSGDPAGDRKENWTEEKKRQKPGGIKAMNVVIISGSAHRNGTTAALLEEFEKGAK